MKSKLDIFKENLAKSIKPKTSWWSLVGIIVFFFLPEIVAYFWGSDIVTYADMMEKNTQGYLESKMYELLKTFGENSIFNITLGSGLVWWFFYERQKE